MTYIHGSLLARVLGCWTINDSRVWRVKGQQDNSHKHFTDTKDVNDHWPRDQSQFLWNLIDNFGPHPNTLKLTMLNFRDRSLRMI